MRPSVVCPFAALLLLMLLDGVALGAPFGMVAISPASTSAGVAATVTLAVPVTDPAVIPSSVNLQSVDAQGRAVVVGNLHDDGLDGDAVAGDNIYSVRFTVYEQNPGTLAYRASAAVSGKLTRVLSNLGNFTVTGASGTGVSLTQPANLAFVNTSPTLVSGTTGDAAATVAVNGIQATKTGNKFQASIPLQEGNNTVTAVASNPNGTTGTASIQVTLDTTPPKVTVASPADGTTTTEASVTVAGIVNDIVVGTVNSQQAKVTVNGAAAHVSNRTYAANNVPLQVGVNTLSVTGRDQTGNSATTTVNVTREAIAQPYVKRVSGNDQSGPVATPLAAPLVVQALNGTVPLPNVPVIFKIVENDGVLNPGKQQTIVVNSDAQGRASASLTLGNRAGAGNNIVQAYAAGYQGTALFTASGVAKTAAKINVDSGNNQFGAVNQVLALPLVAVVTDASHNRLGGVPVTFTVKQGNGKINGNSFLKTKSDSDGRVLAVLTLGTQPGQDNNLVEASVDGLAGAIAAFTASGKVPGDPAQTSVSGVVQDNAGNPIPGVTMRLYTTNLGVNNNGLNNTQHVEVVAPTVTDANGAFKIAKAPVGFFKLMADGGTATQNGKFYPTLEYDMVTVAGQDNGVGGPVYLPELDPDAKACVTATIGGVLKMASAPGFSLTIAPGSATFPGGSKTGCVTVTPVNPDKVPMVPGFGQQPRYVVTIQPVGTTFNPPAAMTIPNLDGLAPHAKTEMYSYDHDLAAFVAIGTGTVSADGSVIASDPGMGVMKAGWHCCGDPLTIGNAGHCPACYKCQGDQCVVTSDNPGECQTCLVYAGSNIGLSVPDSTKDNQCCGGGSGICKAGTCTPVNKIISVTALSAVSANSPQTFPGEKTTPFDPSVSGTPGQHLVVYFKDVINLTTLVVDDFTINLEADVKCIKDSERPWSLKSDTSTGFLNQISSTKAEFKNQKDGGYFRFVYAPSNAKLTEVNVALPLAGAEISARVKKDLALADSFADRVLKKYNTFQINLPSNGLRWFYDGGAGDYLGRPNSDKSPTMRLYNQVNDADGMGAVVTWEGTPIRIAKVSNFLVGYASKKIGVINTFLWISQVLGTGNDESATASFYMGSDIASGSKKTSDLPAFVKSIF